MNEIPVIKAWQEIHLQSNKPSISNPLTFDV